MLEVSLLCSPAQPPCMFCQWAATMPLPVSILADTFIAPTTTTCSSLNTTHLYQQVQINRPNWMQHEYTCVSMQLKHVMRIYEAYIYIGVMAGDAQLYSIQSIYNVCTLVKQAGGRQVGRQESSEAGHVSLSFHHNIIRLSHILTHRHTVYTYIHTYIHTHTFINLVSMCQTVHIYNVQNVAFIPLANSWSI